jgi:hypothetical protein
MIYRQLNMWATYCLRVREIKWSFVVYFYLFSKCSLRIESNQQMFIQMLNCGSNIVSPKFGGCTVLYWHMIRSWEPTAKTSQAAHIEGLFGRAPSAASGAAPAGALPNGGFTRGSTGGAPRNALSGALSPGRSHQNVAPPGSTRGLPVVPPGR